MTIEKFEPNTYLRPFVKAYLVIEMNEAGVNRVLPDTSLALALCYKGKVNQLTPAYSLPLPTVAISGLRKSARLLNYAAGTGTIITIFREAGATAFFGSPLHELFEQSVSLDNLIPRQKMIELTEQCAEASDNVQRINVIERFLCSLLNPYKTDSLISASLRQIHAAKGMVGIKKMAENLFISQDAFEKRFRKIVGTSPKKFSSIVRMRYLIARPYSAQDLSSTLR